MWGSKTKQNKAIKKWHNKAMLVDPRKVEITIIWAEIPKTHESQENLKYMPLNSKTKESTDIADANLLDAEESLKPADPKLEIEEDSFDATEAVPKLEGANSAEKQDFNEADDDLENIETISESLEPNTANGLEAACFAGIVKAPINMEAVGKKNPETLRLETTETLSKNDEVGTLETSDPILQNAEWDRIEAHADSETVADLEITEPNPVSMTPMCSNAPTATVEYLKEEESLGMNAADVYDEPEDCTCELVATERESLNIRFLRVLEKTRSKWYNDKQLAKIVKKMEKGKNLKRKEFDRVYTHIRTYCGYN